MNSLAISVDFQEDLFKYLITDTGFAKYGMFIPSEAFTAEYLSVAWNTVKSLVVLNKEVPDKKVILEETLVEISSTAKRELFGKKLRDILFSEAQYDEKYVEAKIVPYVKKVKIVNFCQGVLEDVDSSDDVPIFNYISRLEDILDYNMPKDDSYLQSVRARFDKYISGGYVGLDFGLSNAIRLAKSELGVILAPPKRGKSLSLITLGYNSLLFGRRVLHLTLELRKEAVEMRYDRAVTGLSKKQISLADNYDKSISVFDRIQKLKGELDVKYFPANKVSVETVYGILSRATKMGVPYDVAIIDYADLLRPETKYKDRRFELSQIYTDLRSIAGDFNVVMWTASQTKRETLRADFVDMADVAEDMGKVAIADLIISLCQSDKEKDSLPERARLFVAGAREDIDGLIIPCTLDRDASRLRVITND